MADKEVYTPKQEDLSNIQDLIGGLDPFVGPPQSMMDPNESPQVTRREILDFGDEGFLLGGVLSEEECQFYIEAAERHGFHEITDVKKSYRNSERLVFHCGALAACLWRRVRPWLAPVTIAGDPRAQHVHGVDSLLRGTWTPHALNPVWRLCRYTPGGHFAPHYDGHLVADSRCRSLQTFMLYLNGQPQFTEGSTNFVCDDQVLYTDSSGKYCAEEKNILCRIDPEPGLAIVFNHHRLHEGQAVKNGTKYILRTDIMFKKDADEVNSLTAVDEEAYQLVQQAERLEAKGDNMAAMQLYRKAFKMSPAVAASFGN